MSSVIDRPAIGVDQPPEKLLVAGEVHLPGRIVYAEMRQLAAIILQPESATVASGDPVTLRVDASGDSPLSYYAPKP